GMPRAAGPGGRSQREQPSGDAGPGIPRALPGTRLAALTLLAALACLPDVDFLWGRHNMETHSLGFAAIMGVAVYAWCQSARLAVAGALAVATHVVFDWLGS